MSENKDKNHKQYERENADQLAKRLEEMLIDYSTQLAGIKNQELIRPVVHELEGEVFDLSLTGPERERLLREHDDLYYQALKILEESQLLKERGIPVELGEAVTTTRRMPEGNSLQTQITKFGEVAALVENRYIDPEEYPTGYRPQLWIPGSAAEKFLDKQLVEQG